MLNEVALRSASGRRLADEWALVLAAEGLHPRVAGGGGRFTVWVPEEEVDLAVRSLQRYEQENRAPPPPEPLRELDPHPVLHAAWVALALGLFFLMTGSRDSGSIWFARGSADAALILAGAWWRAVTALTLHADAGHWAANAAVGTLFGSALARNLGPGCTLGAVVLAGTLGNGINAWAHTSQHVSVGASTAVFAAVGALAGMATVRRRPVRPRGRWLPAAAALALLAFLGSGGEGVDLWAHFFGLLTGWVLGLGFGLAPPPGRALQWIAGLGGLVLVGMAWRLALA